MQLVPDSGSVRRRRDRRRRSLGAGNGFCGPRFHGYQSRAGLSPRRRETVIGFAFALFIHAGVFCCACGLYSEAQIGFKPGNSGITLMLNPSVAMPEIVTKAEPAPDPPAQDPHKHDFEVNDDPEPPKPQQEPDPPTKPKGEPPQKEQIKKDLAVKEAAPPPKKKQAQTPPKEKRVALLEHTRAPVAPPVAAPGPDLANEDIPMDHDPMEKGPDSPASDLEKPSPPRKAAPEGSPSKQTKSPGPVNDAKGNPRPSKYSPEIEGSMREKGVVTNASVNGLETPAYPSSCRRLGHEGDTIYEFTILPNGQCTEITLIQSAGCPELDEAAKEALQRATFVPAKRFGMPVTSRKKLLFRFRLKDVE